LFTYGVTSGGHDVHQLFLNHNANPSSTEEQSESALNKRITEDQEKIQEYAALLKKVCKAARTISKTAVVSVPVSALFHTVVTLPMVKKAELGTLLKAEMRKLLPYPPEEASLEYEIIPAKDHENMQRILVSAAPLSLVSFYTKIFKQAGLDLKFLESESTALTRSLIGRDTALSMIVDMGAERTNFFIIDEARTITQHSIEIGGKQINATLGRILGVPSEHIEQLKYDFFQRVTYQPDERLLTKDVFLDIFMGVVDPILKEIEYSFDLYLRQSSNTAKRPEKIILTGGGAQLPYLANFLADKFKLKCYVGDPWGRVVYQDGLKPILHTMGSRMAVAIGLALRNIV
jgi:type IV pilus assembly protein PilM